MNAETIQHLNALNREFYRVTVDNFDESRGRFWSSGWQRVVERLTPSTQPLRVLDVGCGNGRFGRFLGNHIATPIAYHGIDNNAELLTRAADDLRAYSAVNASFEEIDIVKQMPPETEYDLVVLFGVLHHVPGAVQRQMLLRSCADRVMAGGMMAFTAWCFYEYSRFRERIMDWKPQWQRESGDYLLDWRRGHAANSILRYCHYIDDAEQAQLVNASGLTEIACFRADGHTDDINRYSLLNKAKED